MLKRTGILALLIATLVCAGACADIIELPVDFTGGVKLDVQFEEGLKEYEDPSIRVVREWGPNAEFGCHVYRVDITIASAAQLRTESCSGGPDGFNSRARSATVPQMAKRVNAVVAMDGDSFAISDGHDYVLRQGVLFRETKETWHDLLLIDEDGDFHIIMAGNRDVMEGLGNTFPSTPVSQEDQTMVDGKKVINGFEFGPCIILNGEPVDANPRSIVHPHKSQSWNTAQRICLCQIGPLQYRIVAVAKFGLSVQDFARLVYSYGDVQTAYMFDGGEATQIAFLNKKINNTNAQNIRQVSDIIYFASAWQPD